MCGKGEIEELQCKVAELTKEKCDLERQIGKARRDENSWRSKFATADADADRLRGRLNYEISAKSHERRVAEGIASFIMLVKNSMSTAFHKLAEDEDAVFACKWNRQEEVKDET